ncbi:hypothetical protein LCGC14_2517560 [marine sediment metagenome]|uniref:ATP synthase subunit I n=1 Tax=marine sediment metagenome TaxID=412755 RepID=A0A0F9AXC0_9ZZZZ
MMNRLIKRFSLHALVVCGIAIAASAALFSRDLAFGVFVGGLLGLLNVRGLARGITGLDINNPRPVRLFFGGAFRLFMLFTAIVLIAMTKKVDLVGLLVGFSVVVFVVVIEGMREMRLIIKDEQGEL